MKATHVLNGMMQALTTGRFQVVPCGSRWTDAGLSEAPQHGPWQAAWGDEGAVRFAESMGSGHVLVRYLDGRTESTARGSEAEARMAWSRVEVREVAPYGYARGVGRLTPAQVAEATPIG